MAPSRLRRLIPFGDKSKHNVLHLPFNLYLKLTLQQAGSSSKSKETLEAPAQGLKVAAGGEQPLVE